MKALTRIPGLAAICAMVSAGSALAQQVKIDPADAAAMKKLARANEAQEKGVRLPEQPAKEKQKKAKKMAAMPREKFDERYMQQMVKAHEKAVKETDEMARTARDPDWKAAAGKANAVIREHLQLARQIVSGQGGAAGASSAKPPPK